MTNKLILLFILVTHAAESSVALALWHDVPIEHYKKLAESPQFAPVGFLEGTQNKCTATLIDRYTILTAAHCLKPSNSMGVHDSFKNYQFSIDGTKPVHLIGARFAETHPHSIVAPDLAIAYLETPTFRPNGVIFRDKELSAFVQLGYQVEFAGFGAVMNAQSGETLHPSGIKLAGTSEISAMWSTDDHFQAQFDFLAEGNKDHNLLHAFPWYGDSGMPIMFRAPGAAPKIIAVVVESNLERTPKEHSSWWMATRLYPHLPFLDHGLAEKKVKSVGHDLDWFDTGAWQSCRDNEVLREVVENQERRDAKGTLVRRYTGQISHRMTLSAPAAVDTIHVYRSGALRLGAFSRLQAKDIVRIIAPGQLTFDISGWSSGQLHADYVTFHDRPIVRINFLNLPLSERVANKAEQLDLKIQRRCCHLFSAIWGSISTIALVSPAIPCQREQWTIISADTEIRGDASFHLENVPAGYEAWVEQRTREIVVHAQIRERTR